MAVRDLQAASDQISLRTDVAIIGAGPAGLAIARELAYTKTNVLVIDSGSFGGFEASQSLNRVENIGEPKPKPGQHQSGRGYAGALSWLNEVPAFELRQRGPGGSTQTWAGKCASFDEQDFEKRDWVADSGWPIHKSDLNEYIERAGKLLNLGPICNDRDLLPLIKSPPSSDVFEGTGLRPFFWQYSHDRESGREPMRFQRIASSLSAPNIEILINATVLDIQTDAAGQKVKSLHVASENGKHALIRADVVILAGGAIENARLLMASNSIQPNGLGNENDQVGRYLADHPRTVVAKVSRKDIPAMTRQFGYYGLDSKEDRHFYLHGFALNPEIQKRKGLLNCAAYPVEEISEDDPWLALQKMTHSSGRLSLQDAINVVRAPRIVAQGAFDRLVRKRGLRRKTVEMRFDAICEQEPNPDSRVTLSLARNRLGMRLPKVDWRISEMEIETIRELGKEMSRAFIGAGLPEPLLSEWILSDRSRNLSFMDMAHPSGTTRMGTDRRNSVVDKNCMVHGVDGLYVAGSSVFPTNGHANPMLMVVAMSIRLADHIRWKMDKSGRVRTRPGLTDKVEYAGNLTA